MECPPGAAHFYQNHVCTEELQLASMLSVKKCDACFPSCIASHEFRKPSICNLTLWGTCAMQGIHSSRQLLSSLYACHLIIEMLLFKP